MASKESGRLCTAMTTLIDSTRKVGRTSKACGTALGLAGQKLRSIGADIEALTWILQALQARFSSGGFIADLKGVLPVEEIIELCQNDIRQIQERLLVFGTFEGSGRDLLEWTQWALGKCKVSTTRQTVRTLKLLLTLLAYTLELSNSHGNNRESVREELEYLLAEPVNVKMMFLHAEQLDVQRTPPTKHIHQPKEIVLISSMNKDIDGTTKKLAIVAVHDVRIDEETSQSRDSTGTDHVSVIESDSTDSEAESAQAQNLSKLGSMTDDHFLWIAAHVQLHQAVVECATNALAVPPEDLDRPPRPEYVPSNGTFYSPTSPRSSPALKTGSATNHKSSSPPNRSVNPPIGVLQASMEPEFEHDDDDAIKTPSTKNIKSRAGRDETYRRGASRQERDVLYDPEPAMPPKRRGGRRNRDFVEYWSDYDITDSDQSEKEEGRAKRLVRRMFSRV